VVPVTLDATDIAIIKSLMQDGRKSFRAISREIKISTPTVKARYQRMLDMGLIKSVKPEIDLSKVDKNVKEDLGNSLDLLRTQKKHFHVYVEGLKVRLKCDFCGGPVHDKPKVLKFANIQRFFCCTECRASYKEKHGSRIEMLKEQHKKR
jgi:DNA-binding Lrp family transcriptional regulator